ncbi:DUF6308 family protein [Gordonia sp. NPDC003429]
MTDGRQLTGKTYTGTSFDSPDSLGTRDADANQLTTDDFVAITLLSVDAGPKAALRTDPRLRTRLV